MTEITRQEALDIIIANPGCVAVLDNDCWSVRKPLPEGFDGWSEKAQEDWWDKPNLIDSRHVEGCDYGGGLVEVLALAVNLKTEGV